MTTIPIPILLYHSVSERPPPYVQQFAIPPSAFVEHLDVLRRSGRSPVTVSALVDALDDPDGRLPERPVVVTFDDGWADFVTAAAALAERTLPATLYATTDFLDGASHVLNPLGLSRADTLGWDALSDLAGAGIEIGSHTESHRQLDTIDLESVHREVVRPKQRLEDALSRPVRTFAYPHGYSSRRVRALVRDAGYESACAVRNAFSVPTTERFALARLMVRSTTTADDVDGWLRGCGAPVASAVEPLKTRLWRTYRRARAMVRGGRRAREP